MTRRAMLIGTAKPIPTLQPPVGKNRGVDANEFTPHIDQRAARIARIDGCIGLDEILVALLAEASATESAYQAGRHRLAEAEWIADGYHDFSDLQAVAVAHRNCLEGLRPFK